MQLMQSNGKTYIRTGGRCPQSSGKALPPHVCVLLLLLLKSNYMCKRTMGRCVVTIGYVAPSLAREQVHSVQNSEKSVSYTEVCVYVCACVSYFGSFASLGAQNALTGRIIQHMFGQEHIVVWLCVSYFGSLHLWVRTMPSLEEMYGVGVREIVGRVLTNATLFF